MAETSVKYLHSELPGAPVLSGTAGSLIAVLDACLVNGWGLVTATSVVVAGGVATATFAAGHSFEADTIALITGATPAALNGEQRITSTTTNTVSWATTAPDGTATGTITAKLAPAGWAHPVPSGTNKAAYKSANVAASGCVARIDDSNGRYARLRAYESMTDVDTGVGPTPAEAQVSGGLYVSKSNTADTSPRKWMVVASNKSVLLLVAYYVTYPNDYAPFFFGDFSSLKAGDAYNFVTAGEMSDQSASQYVGFNALSYNNSSAATYVVRSYTQSGGSVPATLRKPGLYSSGSGDSNNPPGPNPINNSLDLVPTLLYEGTVTSAPRRGVIPGVYGIPHALGSSFDSKQRIAAIADLPGHTLIGVRYYSASSGSRYAVDVSGPWE